MKKRKYKNEKRTESVRRIEIVSRLTDDNGKTLLDINTILDTIKKNSCIKKYD